MYPQNQQPPPGYYQQPPPPPPKSSMLKKLVIGVCLLTGMCCLGTMASRGHTPSAASASSPSSPSTGSTPSAAPGVADGHEIGTAVPVGTTVNVSGLEATVLSARFTPNVGHSFTRYAAQEGATLLVVSYRVRNTTNEAIQALSFADNAIAHGASYAPSSQCDMAINALNIGATLNPNLPRTFEACYEVPPDTHGFVVKFNRVGTDRYAQTGL